VQRRWTWMLAVCATIVLAAPGVACAHTPVLEQAGRSDARWVASTGYGPARLFPGAPDIPDPRVSRAVYGTLVDGEAFDAYRFTTTAAATMTIPVGILVPDTKANAGFRPTIAVIGVGDAGSAAGLPSSIRDHLRSVQAPVPVLILADPGTSPRETEYEPFVGETLFKGGSASVAIGGYGTYYVVVYDPHGGTGDYRLALGQAESFTPREALRTPLDVLRIKLGLYGQHRVEWGFAALLAGGVMLATVLVVVLVSARRRRRRGRAARTHKSRSREA
jgi:hypothetical protein